MEHLTTAEIKRLNLSLTSVLAPPAPWDTPEYLKARKALDKSKERLRKVQREALLSLEKAQKGVQVEQARYFSVLHGKAA